MVGVLECRASVLPTSRSASKGEDRYCCHHHVSGVDIACAELTGNAQNRSTPCDASYCTLTHTALLVASQSLIQFWHIKSYDHPIINHSHWSSHETQLF